MQVWSCAITKCDEWRKSIILCVSQLTATFNHLAVAEYGTKQIQLTLFISTSVISNNRLSRTENLVLV